MGFLNKRTILVLITTLLAFLIFHYLVLFPKKIAREEKLKAEVAKLNEEIESVQKDLEKDKARFQKLLHKSLNFNFIVADEIPFKDRIHTFLDKIQRISSQYNIQVQKLELMNEETVKEYTRYPFSLNFLSDYNGLIRFVGHLEDDLNLNLVEFSIESEKGPMGRLFANCILDAYEIKWKEILDASKVNTINKKRTRLKKFWNLSRNPFTRPIVKPKTFIFKETHHLQGIIRFSENLSLNRGLPRAIIDNKVYEVGDELEGKTILDILEDRVLFEGKTPPIVLEKAPPMVLLQDIIK